MNFRILLSVLLLLAVALIYWKSSSNHQKVLSNADLASSDISKKEQIAKESAVKNEISASARQPNQVEIHQSGKYSVKVPTSSTSIEDELKNRDEYLKKNRTGFGFSSGDQNYVLMKLRASLEKEGPAHNRKLDHELQSIDEDSASRAIIDGRSYPVVYNQSNGRLGLVTGVLLVRQLEPDFAQNLAKAYPMDLLTYDSDIKLATYRVRNGEGLYDIYNRIKQNERVDSITVEILDSYKGY